MKFDHPHIIKYYGVQIEVPFINMFLEYAPGGSIKNRIQKYGVIEGDIIKSYIYICILLIIQLYKTIIIRFRIYSS